MIFLQRIEKDRGPTYAQQAMEMGDWSVPLYDFGRYIIETQYMDFPVDEREEELVIKRIEYMGGE